jgi:hypothetical protein
MVVEGSLIGKTLQLVFGNQGDFNEDALTLSVKVLCRARFGFGQVQADARKAIERDSI